MPRSAAGTRTAAGARTAAGTRSALTEPVALTVSGGLQVDIGAAHDHRNAAVQGDGETYPDKTVGVWEATTNLIGNGGFETNTTGWVATGTATIARVSASAEGIPAMFGDSVLKVTPASGSEGTEFAVTLTGFTAYAMSLRVYSASRQGYSVALTDHGPHGLTTNIGYQDADEWVTLEAFGTTNATTSRWLNIVAANTFYLDGAQVEAQPIVTPYVETDGSTAARTIGRVQLLEALGGTPAFTETQGAVFTRARMGFASTDFPHSVTGFFEWADDTDNFVDGYLSSGGTHEVARKSTADGEDTETDTWTAWAAGDSKSWGQHWDATTIAVSEDGGAETTTASTSIPTLSATQVDLGAVRVASSNAVLDSSIRWQVLMSGVPTDTDWATLHAYGNTAPTMAQLLDDLSSGAVPTAVWNGEDLTVDVPVTRTAV